MLIFIGFFISIFSSSAQVSLKDKTLSESAQISVYTCGVGEELYSLFGHTALRVKDVEQNIDLVFNYGMFDFDTPNFYGKFIKGDLLYSIGIDSQKDFIYAYTYADRTITEQILELSAEEIQKIWSTLWKQYESDERYYLYKFIFDNCTTRVHDLIDQTAHYQIKKDFPSNQKTYRQILNDYLKLQYFPQLGINLVFGSNVDQPNELLFLPEQFLEGIHLTDRLQKDVKIWHTSTHKPQEKKQPEKYAFWAFLAIFAFFGKYKAIRNVYYIIATLLGGLILCIQPYSMHEEVLNNWTFLIFNPLMIIMLFIKNPLRRKIAIGQLVLSILALSLLSMEKITIILPLLFLHFVILLWEILLTNKNKK